MGRLDIYTDLVFGGRELKWGKSNLSRCLPCLCMLSARTRSLGLSALGGPSGLSKPAGLGLQEVTGESHFYWRMLVQILLLPLSIGSFFLGDDEEEA